MEKGHWFKFIKIFNYKDLVFRKNLSFILVDLAYIFSLNLLPIFSLIQILPSLLLLSFLFCKAALRYWDQGQLNN